MPEIDEFRKEAVEIVNKLFYVPAFCGDVPSEKVDEDDRVDVIEEALRNAHNRAIEGAANVAKDSVVEEFGHYVCSKTPLEIADAIRRLRRE